MVFAAFCGGPVADTSSGVLFRFESPLEVECRAGSPWESCATSMIAMGSRKKTDRGKKMERQPQSRKEDVVQGRERRAHGLEGRNTMQGRG